MSTTVLTGPLIDFGNSFWRSALAIQEFPGLASTGMKARGKYGIGFFSVFMLGDFVRVATRRFDRDLRSAKLLEFRSGLGSRPNLREAAPEELPLDGGTRIEVRLRKNPTEPEGLLHQQGFFESHVRKFEDMIGEIAPASDVTISIIHDGKTVGGVAPGDWLKVESTDLLQRISPWRSPPSKPRDRLQLAELRDEDGRIYGRARIQAGGSGLITVDGLAASTIQNVEGILIGVETTASRNSAQPTVPAPVLAGWASEQAIAIAAADLTDADKAEAAEVVLACGGNVAELPIIRWQAEWMPTSHFAEVVKCVERLMIHEGDITHDDDDDVPKRAFEFSFEQDPNIASTVSNGFGGLHNSAWIAAVVQGKGLRPIQLIENVLLSVWGATEHQDETVVVGEVNGTEIYRIVTIYSRSNDDEEISEE